MIPAYLLTTPALVVARLEAEDAIAAAWDTGLCSRDRLPSEVIPEIVARRAETAMELRMRSGAPLPSPHVAALCADDRGCRCACVGCVQSRGVE